MLLFREIQTRENAEIVQTDDEVIFLSFQFCQMTTAPDFEQLQRKRTNFQATKFDQNEVVPNLNHLYLCSE